MKRLLFLIHFVLILLCLSACGHKHVWVEATCTEPKTCIECGEIEGEPLGHCWKEADCVNPRTCSVCGETNGNPLGHTGKWDNCTGNGVCIVCGDSLPPKGHQWIEATCTEPKTCDECGATEGQALGHTVDAGICKRCGEYIEAPLVTYDQIIAGGYEEKTIRIQAIVGDVYIETLSNNSYYETVFDLWYPTNDSYFCFTFNIIHQSEIEKEVLLEPIKEITDGDIIELTTHVYGDNSFGMSGTRKIEIVGHTDIGEVYSKVMNNSSVFDYNDVLRNPKNYGNHREHLFFFSTLNGTIYQIIDRNSFLLKTDSGMVYVNSYGGDEVQDSLEHVNLIEGDSVTIYGEVTGVKKYSSLLKDNTVPNIDAAVIILN